MFLTSGHHFNSTQISNGVEVSEFDYALDYQIAICFEIENIALSKEHVLQIVEERFRTMNIKLGTLLGSKPIAILCAHNSNTWNGIVKVHLKTPQVDGEALLNGLRPFILKLDESRTFRGKVCKPCDNIAPPKLISTRIHSVSLIGKSFHDIHYEIVDEGFRRGSAFEVTSVQKHADQDIAWIRSTSPEEALKIRAEKFFMDSEVFVPRFAPQGKLSEDDKAKKQALQVIAQGLNKVKTREDHIASLKNFIGAENIVNIFFKEGEMSCNVELLNPAVFTKFSRKNFKSLGHYVELVPHPRSLHGKFKPKQEDIVKWGFTDIFTALQNTVQTITVKEGETYTKKELDELLNIAVTKSSEAALTEVRKEMGSLKTVIITEAKTYAEKVVTAATSAMTSEMRILRAQLKTTLAALDQLDGPES